MEPSQRRSLAGNYPQATSIIPRFYCYPTSFFCTSIVSCRVKEWLTLQPMRKLLRPLLADMMFGKLMGVAMRVPKMTTMAGAEQ